jgi:hypothetical protein
MISMAGIGIIESVPRSQEETERTWIARHVLEGCTFSMMDVFRPASFFSTFSRSAEPPALPPARPWAAPADATNEVSLLTELMDTSGAEADVTGDSALTTAPTALALLIFCV